MKRFLPTTSSLWQRCLVALLIIGVASAIRATFFGDLGRGIPYLTYYPAVMLAALYGGLAAGLLATAVAGYLCFAWIQRGFMSHVETLAIMVFLVSSTLIGLICEAMHRSRVRAKQAQEKTAATVQELQRETAERQQASAAAETSHQQLAAILSNLYAGVLAVSATGLVEQANQAFCDIFGLAEKPEALRGLSSREVIRRIRAVYADPAQTLARIQAIVAEGKAVKGEEVALQDGRLLMVDFIPLEADGRRQGHIWHHHDITARKRAEERTSQLLIEAGESRELLGSVIEDLMKAEAEKERLLAETEESRRVLLGVVEDQKFAEDEIRLLNVELEQRVLERTAELAAANHEMEAFSYSVSHDLRAPLRSIDGFSRVLLEDYAAKLDDEGRDHLARVRAAAQRMGHLIDDLLNLSRVSRVELRREPVDLSALARAVAAELQQRHPTQPVALAVTDGLRADADPRLLQVVLENLLGNAWKFTGKAVRPRIEFGAVQQDGQTCYFVRDNGAGFDAAYAGKLFNAFQRLHSSADFPGTGIGLATVRRIVSRHGGRVWAEAAVNLGATFYFTLGTEAEGGRLAG